MHQKNHVTPHALCKRPNGRRQPRQCKVHGLPEEKVAEQHIEALCVAGFPEGTVVQEHIEALCAEGSVVGDGMVVQDEMLVMPCSDLSSTVRQVQDTFADDSAFFAKHTYSNECALLAHNFHNLVTKLEILKHFHFQHDHRLIGVMLAYMFHKFEVHPHDTAVYLAVTLVYLEDVMAAIEVLDIESDAFNLVCFLAFLAHTFNGDRAIPLADWHEEIGKRSFSTCQDLNKFVFFLFSHVRGFNLRVPADQVNSYVQQLRDAPKPE